MEPITGAAAMKAAVLIIAAMSMTFGGGAGVVGGTASPADPALPTLGETVAVGELLGGACYFDEQSETMTVTPDQPFRYERWSLTPDCRLELTLLCTERAQCPDEFDDAASVNGEEEPLVAVLSHCSQTSGHAAAAFWTEGLQAHYIDPPGVQNGVREDRLTEVWNEIYYYWSCSDGQPYVWSASGGCPMNTDNGWHLHAPCQNPTSCSYLSGSYCRNVRGDTFGCHNINFCTFGSHYQHMLEGGIRIWNDNFLVCSRTWSGSLPPHGDDTHLDSYCAYL